MGVHSLLVEFEVQDGVHGVSMAPKRASSSSACSSTATKKPKLYCHFKSTWRTQVFTVHLSDPPRSVTVSGEVLSGIEGGDKATCKACGVKFSVHHGGSNDVVKHFSSKHHLQAILAMCSSNSMQTLDTFGFGQSEVDS